MWLWQNLRIYPYFFGWLEKWVGWLYKYSLHVENKSKVFWNKVSLLLKDLASMFVGKVFIIISKGLKKDKLIEAG